RRQDQYQYQPESESRDGTGGPSVNPGRRHVRSPVRSRFHFDGTVPSRQPAGEVSRCRSGRQPTNARGVVPYIDRRSSRSWTAAGRADRLLPAIRAESDGCDGWTGRGRTGRGLPQKHRLQMGSVGEKPMHQPSPGVERAVEAAAAWAVRLGAGHVRPVDLILGLFDEEEGRPALLLERLGVGGADVGRTPVWQTPPRGPRAPPLAA